MKASNIQIDIKDKKKSQKDTHIGDSRLYELEYEVSIPDNDLSRTGYRIGKAKGYLEATSHDRDMKNPAFKAAFEAGKQKGFSFGKRDNLRSFHRDSSGSEDDSLVEELFGDESDGDRIISLDIRRERDDDGVTDDSDFEPPRGLGANSRPGVRRSPRKGGIGGDHNKDEGEDGQGSTRQRGTRTTGNRDQGRQKTRCERSENKDKEDEDSDEDEEMTDPPDHDDDDEDVSSEGVPEAEESEGHRDEGKLNEHSPCNALMQYRSDLSPRCQSKR